MGDGFVPTPCDAAIEIGEIAFLERQPDSANPFESGDLRAAWITGWRFAEAKAERDALERKVWALESAVADLQKAIDRLEARQ
jgi:hypothetical protein